MVRTVDDEGVVDDEEAADEERVTCLHGPFMSRCRLSKPNVELISSSLFSRQYLGRNGIRRLNVSAWNVRISRFDICHTFT